MENCKVSSNCQPSNHKKPNTRYGSQDACSHENESQSPSKNMGIDPKIMLGMRDPEIRAGLDPKRAANQ